MKISCPACSARYTIADERLDGRRVKVRCRRCGESFPVASSDSSGKVCARRTETGRARDVDLFAITKTPSEGTELTDAPAAKPAPALTGERHESSVLFSLASLSTLATGSANGEAPASAKVTESSALIDIRALLATSTTTNEPGSTRADDILNLSSGGAFAPLFAPPVTFDAVESEAPAPRTRGPIVIGALAIAVVALIGVAAFASTRTRPTALAAATTAPVATATSEAPLPIGSAEVPPAPSAPPVASAPPKQRPTLQVAAPARSTVAAPTASAPTASTKCCAGESEIACHMRLATHGAGCQTETAPFDRAAAARALGVNMTSCKRAEGPTGSGHVKVTFQPSGSVSAVEVDPPFAGTATGACIARRYREVAIPAFSGSALSVGKTFAVE
jgi:predicted Zn finger-like uncharacterized protein